MSLNLSVQANTSNFASYSKCAYYMIHQILTSLTTGFDRADIQVHQTAQNVPHRPPLYDQLPPMYDPAWAPTK
ncbi:hypothetical protein DPMN_172535 [Dreissena polymorpha]|uniref:Uncharacterized protein n=1 Tax=Dreissena polymorpha TaxID=45954 RepID=A0A9D4E126_DREPO|nr:hypothetical protein DPMN_172535 [Dreissena polymorpha]